MNFNSHRITPFQSVLLVSEFTLLMVRTTSCLLFGWKNYSVFHRSQANSQNSCTTVALET